MQSQLPHVRLENFEGPFDLLIELARDSKVDLADVSLSDITEAFLEYIQEHPVPIELRGDFTMVAAMLLYLKVQQLSPVEEEDDEEGAYDLTDRVLMYNLYREQAERFRVLWGKHRLVPARAFAPKEIEAGGMPRVAKEDLQQQFEAILKRLPKPTQPRAHLTSYGRTLKDWLSDIERKVADRGEYHYQQEVAEESDRDRAVSFLAILQLAHDEKVSLHQQRLFDDLLARHISYE